MGIITIICLNWSSSKRINAFEVSIVQRRFTDVKIFKSIFVSMYISTKQMKNKCYWVLIHVCETIFGWVVQKYGWVIQNNWVNWPKTWVRCPRFWVFPFYLGWVGFCLIPLNCSKEVHKSGLNKDIIKPSPSFCHRRSYMWALWTVCYNLGWRSIFFHRVSYNIKKNDSKLEEKCTIIQKNTIPNTRIK